MSDEAVKIAEESGRRRFVFVDALRGIAAVLVVMHHLLDATPMEATLRRVLPGWYCATSVLGSRGVQIFFVISGFVIAHSMREVVPTVAALGRFIVRRQVRLDPPYWCLIALTLLVHVAEHHGRAAGGPKLPGLAEAVANFFYLQRVIGTDGIVTVGWTLCLEVQFYLLYVVAVAIGYRLGGRRSGPNPWTAAIVAVTGLGCLAAYRQQAPFATWFWAFWPYFAFGVVCYWARAGARHAWLFAGYAAAFGVVTVLTRNSLMLVGLLTALSLGAAVWSGGMHTWGANAACQYFGRISYSLYLVHLTAINALLGGGHKLTGDSRPAAIGWYLLAIVVSVGSAHLFHRWVEVPSMRWSSRLKARPAGRPTTDPPPPVPEATTAGAVAAVSPA